MIGPARRAPCWPSVFVPQGARPQVIRWVTTTVTRPPQSEWQTSIRRVETFIRVATALGLFDPELLAVARDEKGLARDLDGPGEPGCLAGDGDDRHQVASRGDVAEREHVRSACWTQPGVNAHAPNRIQFSAGQVPRQFVDRRGSHRGKDEVGG